MRRITSFIPIILSLILLTATAVQAQESSLEVVLSDLGLVDPQISMTDNSARVVYKQAVAEMGSFESELTRIALVLELFGEHLPAESQVTLEQRFDDGQIMQVVGSPSLGGAFLKEEIDLDTFEMALRFEPLTRGPLIYGGTCDLPAGDTCESNPACACYPNERCAPADTAASPKGCVIETEPANAQLEGSEWACVQGYTWNAEMTGCEATVACPEGSTLMGGECVEALPTPVPDTPLDQGFSEDWPEEAEEPLTGLMSPSLLLLCAGGCICGGGLLVAAAVAVFLVLKRRKG